MKGFILKNNQTILNLTSYKKPSLDINYLSLLGRIYRLTEMLNKRVRVLSEWNELIEKLIKEDIKKINIELNERINQLNNISYSIKNKKEIYKVRIDVLTQKNGYKFYRGRINIPKNDRINFNLKTPRKEFLIKRNEVRILVKKVNGKKPTISMGVINKPTFIINGQKVINTQLGREFQYLVYEKYLNYLKNKINQIK
jgi:hypothetical protein